MGEKFVRETQETLEKCAIWLYRRAHSLAGEFHGGCRDWEVSFSAGEDGMFPKVGIKVTRIDHETLDMLYGALRNGEIDQDTFEETKEKIEESDFILKTVKKDDI